MQRPPAARGASRIPKTWRVKAAAGALAFLAAGGCATVEPPATEPADAATAGADAGELAALENAFWYCDWMATTRGVLATPMAACQFATDELKARKFGGSSRALAAWWRENKAAEHARLGQ